MSLHHQTKRRARYYRLQQCCQHEGCTNQGIPCFLFCWNKIPDDYICPEHAAQYGYCVCCGQFWGGIESFEMRRSGLCDQCNDQAIADFNDHALDEDEDYNGDLP